MEIKSLANELNTNSYPGRGIVLGQSDDGKFAVAAYFIMGRSVNSRNRILRKMSVAEYVLRLLMSQKWRTRHLLSIILFLSLTVTQL